MLRIAISKELQISKDIEYHLVHSGLNIDFKDKSNQLFYSSKFPAEIKFLDRNHIFTSITVGFYDLAIVSEHFLLEQSREYEKMYVFEKTTTPLCVFFANNTKYKDVLSLGSKSIATNVPELVRRFCKSQRVRGATIIFDEKPQNVADLGIADCFVDLAHNLESKQYYVAESIMETPIVLIASPKITPEKRHIFVDEFLYRLKAVDAAQNKIKVEIICDMKHRTRLITEIRKIDENLLALSSFNQEKIIIHATMDEKQLWDISHFLKDIKAEKIIVYDISKIIE